MNWRALVAEAVGTFTLLTFGFLGVATVSILTNGAGDRLIAVLIVPFAFGLGLMAAIGLGGHASGGHFNPAVTLAALIDRRVTAVSAIAYVVAQLVGGLVAALGILVITSQGVVRLAVNGPGPTTSGVMSQELNAFGVEIVLTAIFVAVILTVSRNSPQQAILVIPFTLVAIHFAGMHVSGASVNPVRSLAPALVSGTYSALWVYLAGPLLGGALGWGIYRLMLPPEDEVSIEIEDDYLDELDDLEVEDEAIA
jgi:MIP family channel proteins